MLTLTGERDWRSRSSETGKEAPGNAPNAGPLVQGGEEGRMAWFTPGPPGVSLGRSSRRRSHIRRSGRELPAHDARDLQSSKDLRKGATEPSRIRSQGVDEMGMRALDPVAYGKLLAAELPQPIQNDRDFDSMVARLEELDFAKRKLTQEEKALREILAALIEVYDEEHYQIPEQPPHEMVKFLMEQRGLKQADLVSVLGSRAQVSDLVNGKRGISKAQAKKLAEYFGVSAELFI